MLNLLIISLLGGLILQVFIPGFPKETLLIQAGISFGLVGGSIINYIGMVIGAQVAYEISRSSVYLSGYVTSLLEDYKETKWYKRIEEDGNKGLLLLRLIPYAPNDILSFLSGILLLPRKYFILVSLVTAWPFAIIFASIGVFGSELVGQQTVIWINIIMMVIFLVGYIVYRGIVNYPDLKDGAS